MKKLVQNKDIISKKAKQELIDNLKDDCLTVLESYINEIEDEELLYEILKFYLEGLIACIKPHSYAMKILNLALDSAIDTHRKNYLQN